MYFVPGVQNGIRTKHPHRDTSHNGYKKYSLEPESPKTDCQEDRNKPTHTLLRIGCRVASKLPG